MPTTVTSSIGTTGRTYSTLQAWEDAIPADLVTADQLWLGECYNDSEFTAGVTIASHTTDVTRYIVLTAAAGQSFQDHAGVRTNPLIYDQSKGVGVNMGTSSIAAVVVSSSNYTRVQRLQVTRAGAAYDPILVAFTSSSNAILRDCIIGQTGVSANSFSIVEGPSSIINCLIYDKTTSGTSYGLTSSAAVILNCTIVNGRGSAQGRGINLVYANVTINNTAIFGWTTAVNGTTVTSGDYNATDAGSFPGGGSNNQVSKTYANQFESTTADWRLKTGSDCINTGNTNASLAPLDISLLARGATTAGDIGAWEYAAAGAAVSYAALMGTTTTISWGVPQG